MMRQQVALLVDLECRYGVDVLRGACRIGHELGWEMRFSRPPWSSGDPNPFPRRVDGVIGYLDQELASRLVRMGIPCVNLTQYPDAPAPPALIDEQEVGRCGAHHLLDQGLTSLAAVTLDSMHPVGTRRIVGFHEVAEAAGASCQDLCLPAGQPAQLVQRLIPWIASLPAPTGVFGVGDYVADMVLVACQDAGIMVPNRIAVVGADNDEIRCLLAPVPLSSVAMPHEALGAAAAQHLETQFAKKASGPTVVLAPGPVIARASSDGLAGRDPILAKAVAFIRSNLTGNLSVDRIAAAAEVNRRTLERRFRTVLRRSVHDEIRRLRIQQGMELLAGGNLTIAAIAVEVGLSHNAFIAAFHHTLGTTPGAWRLARTNR